MRRVFGKYSSVVVDGDVKYAARVEDSLKSILTLADGPRFFDALCLTPHTVTIKDTSGGNSCTPNGDGVNPVLLLAMTRNHQAAFQEEMLVALNRSAGRGLTVEHIARQLAAGLTPATYRASQNAVHRGLSFS